jgi:hypothetical protein
MRKLNFHHNNKKLRGVKRHLRNLKEWSDSFENYFPNLDDYDDRYFNWKISVPLALVQGKHSTQQIKAECAQYLINACNHLIKAKPNNVGYCKVTCCIILPDMFASEICLYLDEDYFNSHTCLGAFAEAKEVISSGESLAGFWGLEIPEGMFERGIHTEYIDPSDLEENYISDSWYFIEK